MVLSQAREIVATYGGAAALAVGRDRHHRRIAWPRRPGGWLVGSLRRAAREVCEAHALALSGGLLLTLCPRAPLPCSGSADPAMGYGFVSGSTAGGHRRLLAARDYGRIAGPHLHRLDAWPRSACRAGRLPVRTRPAATTRRC